MFKQFFKDSAIYGLANILARSISLILLPFYTRVLTPTDYGIIDILLIFTTLINLTIALEISQAVARYFPEALTPQDKVSYASTALWFTVGVNVLFISLAYFFAAPLSQWLLESATQQHIFRVAVFSIGFNSIFYLVQNQLRWELQPKLFAIANLTFTFFSISTAFIFVLILQWGVIGVLYGQLVGNVVGSVLSLYFARHSYHLKFDGQKCRAMLTFSMPLVPSSIGVFITLYIDRIAIKELLTMQDVGLFGIGYRVASVIGLLMVAFQSALTPLVYTHYQKPETPATLAKIFRYFVALALLIFLTLAMFSREILIIFTTPDYYGAAVVIPFLIPAILLSNMYIFAPGLGIAKKTGMIALINLLGALLNMALNFIFIPLLGIQGAALATLISAVGVFSAYMFYGQKHYFVPHGWQRLLMATVITVGLFLLSSQINLALGQTIVLKFILISFALGMLVKTGLIEITDIHLAWHQVAKFAKIKPIFSKA